MTAKIHIPTFETDVIFITDKDRDYIRKYLKRNFFIEIDNLNDDFSGITVYLRDMVWMIYVPDTKMGDFIWLIKTLSHESTHVVLQMVKKIGITDDEAICYIQDNLLGQLLKKITKKRKNGK